MPNLYKGKKVSSMRPCKPGNIVFRYAWDRKNDLSPDWWVNWEAPADKGTSNLILTELSKLSEELVKRGYDPLSIRFSCSKPKFQQTSAPEINI